MATIKQTALKAIKEAGTILLENLDHIASVELKQKNDYLTNVDIAAEKVIKQIIETEFPDHSIFAEETTNSDKKSAYTWYIDPISSTHNYVHGLPHFATAIAVQKDKDIIFSAVYDPFFNELFYAEKGKGAFLNDKRIYVSKTEQLSKAFVSFVIRTRNKGTSEQDLKLFNEFLPKVASYRRLGSVALELSYIAAGRLDGQVFLGSDVYAVPAGVLLIQEAGGKCTDVSGNTWTTQSQSIIASNGRIHSEIITGIKLENN